MVFKRATPALAALVLVLSLSSELLAQDSEFRALAIPPTLEGSTFDLTLHDTTHTFFDEFDTATSAFNGSWLGPTLIFNKGDDVEINVANELGEPTTVHWHGMHVSAMNDGGPHTVIEDGTTWHPAFPVLNKAATLWYHPHLHMFTNEHVYRGLAGMIIVRDDVEAALTLPRTYGIDDIPLFLQDRDFDEEGQLVFASMGQGAIGGTYVINGTINPLLEAPAQVMRFRVVNASSSRVYNVGASDNRMLAQIASDGGLLENTLDLARIRLSPGERAEFLVDFAGEEGDTLSFINYASELINGERGGASDSVTPLDGVDSTFLTIEVVAATAEAVTTIPTELVTIDRMSESEAVRVRPMAFSNDESSRPYGINGVGMDLDVINEVVNLNDTEIWELTNETTDPHPFHIHNVDFQILDRDGVAPPDNERGWKDVVLVYPDEVVRFITKFTDFADPDTPYMYHCHLLDHEDRGMMGQFIVIDNSTDTEVDVRSHETMTIRNFPNPFSGQTTLTYNMPYRSELRIEVFNAIGQQVKVLFDGVREQGNYETIWKAGDFANGQYFVRFTTPAEVHSHGVVIRSN